MTIAEHLRAIAEELERSVIDLNAETLAGALAITTAFEHLESRIGRNVSWGQTIAAFRRAAALAEKDHT